MSAGYHLLAVLSGLLLVVVSGFGSGGGVFLNRSTNSFGIVQSLTKSTNCGMSSSTLLQLASSKKRRRRKKPLSDTSSTSEVSAPLDDDFGELPEFDLYEDEEEVEEKVQESSSVVSSSSLSMEEAIADGMADPAVRAAMMQSGSSSVSTSAKDVLRSRDRAIEATFEFDEVASPLPRPGATSEPASSLPSYSGMSKKQAKREARKAAAIAAEAEREASKSVFDSLKEIVDANDDDGLPKILSQGTWACIIILLIWEAYINSPFFERSQPLIPVVYELLN